MLGAALLVFIFVSGLRLIGVIPTVTGKPFPEWDGLTALVGWAMVLLPVFKWRVVWRGGQKIGGLVVYAAIIALAAWIFSGVPIWEMF